MSAVLILLGCDRGTVLFLPPSTHTERCVPVSYTHLDVYKRQDDILVVGYHNNCGSSLVTILKEVHDIQ